jgi:hypothetical protein
MIALPKGYTRLQCVKWLLQEIEELIKSHNIEKIAMKKSEAMSKGSAYEERVEHEAAVYLAAANCGLRLASKRAGSTIAKGLGLKGRAKYLAQFDTSALPSYRSLPPKVQEAVLAGWSDLL